MSDEQLSKKRCYGKNHTREEEKSEKSKKEV